MGRKSKKSKKTKRIQNAAQSPPVAPAGSSFMRAGLDRSMVQPCIVPVHTLIGTWPQPATSGAVLLQGCYLAPHVHMSHSVQTVPFATSSACAQQSAVAA